MQAVVPSSVFAPMTKRSRPAAGSALGESAELLDSSHSPPRVLPPRPAALQVLTHIGCASSHIVILLVGDSDVLTCNGELIV